MKESIYLWKYYCLKWKTCGFYRDLLRNQFLSQDEIEAISWAKTKKLLEYAYENVPYYHDKYKKSGIVPNDIKTQSDFQYLPLLTKNDIRNNFQKMISREASIHDLNVSATGGSTGHVLKLYHQKNVPRAAIGWRMLGWWGLPPCCDSAWIWRMGNHSLTRRAMRNLIDWPAKTIKLNAAKMDEANMKAFVEAYNNSRVQLVHGYVGGVDHLASFILENGISMRPPKAVSTTASPITAVQEKRIEAAFGAPVFDQYGCNEVYWLSAQCKERKALHRFHDTRRIEFIDDNNLPCEPGTQGRIVLTNLESFYFPIIRYLNGDLGAEVSGKCPCGVKLPLMKKVTGRISETIIMPDGTAVSGDYLNATFDRFPESVKQFQVHQQADGKINIRFVSVFCDEEMKPVLSKIENMYHTDFGKQVEIKFLRVDEIPHIRGKYRYIVSDYTG